MKNYLQLMKSILEEGSAKTDRTRIGTVSLFGPQLEFDLREGFPAVTTKKLHFASVVRELRWMISGSTNVRDLHPCKIWDAWADENGNLGPVYGHQWRKWWNYRKCCSVDQLLEVIERIKTAPDCRRLIVSAWNVADLPQMRLAPCHILFQFNVGFVTGTPTYLDCKMYQRSADYFLGVPFNIAQYALLTHIVASLTNLLPRRLITTFGDCHIYLNHIEQCKLQLTRSPHSLPDLEMPRLATLEDFVSCSKPSVNLKGYKCHPPIEAEIAI